MSDESFPPADADRPATTIWSSFARTRFVLAVLASFPVLFWMLAYGLATPTDGIPGLLFGPAMAIHSVVFITVCVEVFGQRTVAFVVILALDALWLLAGVCYVFLCFELRYPDDFNAAIAIFTMLVLMHGVASFFVTYLLWRTNKGS